MRVLIVEDEKLLAESIKTLLERKGFTVELAFDGVTGAEYAETGIYDLLILDVMMPGMDVYAVARQVRQKRPAGAHRAGNFGGGQCAVPCAALQIHPV